MSDLRNTVILCGAGVSADEPSRLPSGEKLARRLVTLVLKDTTLWDGDARRFLTTRPQKSQEELRLELVFELLARYLDPRALVRVYELFIDASPNRNHLALLCTRAHKIFTTNQDILFERARRLLVPLRTVQFVHLHGRCDQPSTIVTLVREYLKGLPEDLHSDLIGSTKSRDVVVIGYSGRDRDVMASLMQSRPRRIRWLHRRYRPDLPPELVALSSHLGAKFSFERVPELTPWLYSRVDPSLVSDIEDAVKALSPRLLRLSKPAMTSFQSLEKRPRTLAITKVLQHQGQSTLAAQGLIEYAATEHDQHPDVLLQVAEVRASSDRVAARLQYEEVLKMCIRKDRLRSCSALLGLVDLDANNSDYETATDHLNELRTEAKRLRQPERNRFLAWAAERSSRLKVMTNDQAGALRDGTRAIRLFHNIHDLDGIVTASTFYADVLRSAGRYREAEATLQEVNSDAGVYLRVFWQPWTHFYTGILQCSMGQTNDGLIELTHAEDLAKSTGNIQAEVWTYVMKSCYLRALDLKEAEIALRRAEQSLMKSKSKLALAFARILFERAELARGRRDYAGTTGALKELRLWTASGVQGSAPYLLAHASAIEAELARDVGDPEAMGMLRTVRDLYRNMRAGSCVARISVSMWLLRGGDPSPRLVEQCRREGYGLELRQLMNPDPNSYYPLHVL